MTTAKQLDEDLIDHACSQLAKSARKHVREGMGPASAASAAIRETKALFPHDWRLAVQGDDREDSVEVWEVEHKREVPCARVVRESEEDAVERLITSVRERARASTDPDAKRVAKLPRARLLLILEAAMPETEDQAYRAAVAAVATKRRPSKASGASGHATKRRAYDINPSSPEVIAAFMKSGYPATEDGIQEFIAKHYGNWMRQYRKRLDPRSGDPRSRRHMGRHHPRVHRGARAPLQVRGLARMPDPKNITEETTLAELREQRLLLEVIALRVYPSVNAWMEGAAVEGQELQGPMEASVHHATGFYVGTGPTEATAIEDAFAKLRRALLPEPIKQYLDQGAQ